MLRDFAKVIAASRTTTTVTVFMVVDFHDQLSRISGVAIARQYRNLSELTSSMYS